MHQYSAKDAGLSVKQSSRLARFDTWMVHKELEVTLDVTFSSNNGDCSVIG